MSILIQENEDTTTLGQDIETALTTSSECPDFREVLEHFTNHTLSTHSFHLGLFRQLMTGANLSCQQLYESYVGKNVLNFFRQNNGYQTGQYIKTWAGREDNEHLVEIIASLDASQPNFQQELYTGLQEKYQALTNS